jgi:hypothetical protein
MLSVYLPKTIEKQFLDIVKNDYDGDPEAAFVEFLKIYKKYGWKEQLLQDVKSVRAEVKRQGGISQKTIEDAIKKYRKEVSE